MIYSDEEKVQIRRIVQRTIAGWRSRIRDIVAKRRSQQQIIIKSGEYDAGVNHNQRCGNEVSVHPFMDTQGLYVRGEYYNDVDYENGGGNGFNLESQNKN